MKKSKRVKFAMDKQPVLAQDPPVSEAQRKAMFAAAEGNSTLGIPKKVGEEFVGKDYASDSHIKGAGILVVAKDTGRVLFLKRSPSSNRPGNWDLPGGRAEDGETPEDTARRETFEEIGVNVSGSIKQMSDTKSPDDAGKEVNFITFWHECPHEFKPKLDKQEHTDYRWADPRDPPQPLHPGVKITIDAELAQDASPLSAAAMRMGAVGGLSSSPAKVAAARINGARHGHDAALAFDKASVRSFDIDGRLKVEVSNISKEMICPYLGSEIPDPNGHLGLDPNKIYKLLRDGEELAKGADTFNNIQLLSEHVPVSTTDIQKELIIGCTGTDSVFETPYLKNSLCVWTEDGIQRVENKDAQEISCSYRYDADMTPGVFKGEPYDGVMRNIHGNHVILTPAGRCGPTVIVGDSAIAVPPSRTNLKLPSEKKTMSQTLSKKALRVRGVLQAVLQPRLAADKMPDLDAMLAGIDKNNWMEKKVGLKVALAPFFAADAKPDDLVDSLDPEKPKDKDVAEDAVEGILAHCRGKMGDDELGEVENKVRALSAPKKADDEDTPMTPVEKPAVKAAADEEDKDMKDKVSKTAMDAAIKAGVDATVKRINAIHEAREIVAPFVGKLNIACDSSEDVYRAALKVLGVRADNIHHSALRTILEMQPNPNATKRPVLAADSVQVTGLAAFLTEQGLGGI